MRLRRRPGAADSEEWRRGWLGCTSRDGKPSNIYPFGEYAVYLLVRGRKALRVQSDGRFHEQHDAKKGLEMESQPDPRGSQDTNVTVRLVGVEEMASLLGVHRSWLYERTRKNPPQIPCVRVGRHVRFDAATVIAFLSEAPTPKSTDML